MSRIHDSYYLCRKDPFSGCSVPYYPPWWLMAAGIVIGISRAAGRRLVGLVHGLFTRASRPKRTIVHSRGSNPVYPIAVHHADGPELNLPVEKGGELEVSQPE